MILKRVLKAARLFWWAIRHPGHEDAVVAWRVAKSQVWPTTYYRFNSNSPETTSTTEWFGKTLTTTTIENPFYELGEESLSDEPESNPA